jgi:hypothetical protein
MKNISSLYLLSFSSYWENSRIFRFFGWDTYCTAATMELLSTSKVKILDRKVALDLGKARGGKSWRRILQKSEKILQAFSKIRENFLRFFKNRGRGPLPPLPRSRGPPLDLPLDEMVCHAKFGCTGSYRDQVHKEQTNKLSSLYMSQKNLKYSSIYNINFVF